MKGNIGILMVIAVMCPSGSTAWGMPTITPDAKTEAAAAPAAATAQLDALIGRLEGLSPFSARVDYEVSLAMTDEDVVYDLDIASTSAPADTRFGADYLIDWTLHRNGEDHRGFTAYFDGHCYRYRDNRLQEYHFSWDSIPFVSADGGVQANGQFVDLLPRSLARQLRAMTTADGFTVEFRPATGKGEGSVDVVTASQSVKGYVGRNFRLTVDHATGRPLKVENEYNPAQISEQSVRAVYTYPSGGAEAGALRPVAAEEQLIAMYPEVFENFRESNYRIENIRGQRLPGFSLPTTTGERYTRAKGDPFRAPTVVAILSADNAAAAPTVAALRKAVDSMPREVDLVMVFTGSHIDSIEEITGPELRPGEAVLMSGRSLARDCGTSVFPTVIIADTDGTVANVSLGFNNSLTQDVIQSIALLK